MIDRYIALAIVTVVLTCSACSSESTRNAEIDAGMEGGLEPDGGETNPKCNGREELCERRYDAIAHPMTHNAMSNAAAEWVAPNQAFGISRQLEDGIRGLMLDTYEEEGELLLCHVICLAGKLPLVDGLGEIRAFLDSKPNEVISIIFENYITHEQTAGAFDDADLTRFVYAHEVGEPWPTLRELIDDGTRLVVFQETLPQDDTFPWLMNVWEHAWETPFSFSTPEELSCDPNRGSPANPLFLLNHFLTAPLGGRPDLAEMVNYNPLFIDRARECEMAGEALPNFVAVDFYDIGDLLAVVDALNGF